jgi:hypothetical protein
MAKRDVVSVEITFANGEVDHYLVSAGDTISCNDVKTYTGDTIGAKIRDVHYTTLQLTHPSKSTKG